MTQHQNTEDGELQHTVAEEYVAKKTLVAKRRNKRLKNHNYDGEKRIKFVKSYTLPVFDDDDLDGIDLRRVKNLGDLPEEMRL
jgi:hypothetical protein